MSKAKILVAPTSEQKDSFFEDLKKNFDLCAQKTKSFCKSLPRRLALCLRRSFFCFVSCALILFLCKECPEIKENAPFMYEFAEFVIKLFGKITTPFISALKDLSSFFRL